MKKWLVFLLVLATIICLFTGCATKEEQLSAEALKLEAQISELETKISNLKSEKSKLEKSVTDLKVDTGTAKYVLTINIKQSHFTLDLSEHLKDSMNDISIQIPVDKEYYDSVKVGDIIDDSFRMGSFVFKGSWGNWRVTVKNKEIR